MGCARRPGRGARARARTDRVPPDQHGAWRTAAARVRLVLASSTASGETPMAAAAADTTLAVLSGADALASAASPAGFARTPAAVSSKTGMPSSSASQRRSCGFMGVNRCHARAVAWARQTHCVRLTVAVLQVAHMSSSNITQDEPAIARLARLSPAPAQGTALAADLAVFSTTSPLAESHEPVEATARRPRAALREDGWCRASARGRAACRPAAREGLRRAARAGGRLVSGGS